MMNFVTGGSVEPENEEAIKDFVNVMKGNPLTNNLNKALKMIDQFFADDGWQKFATTNSDEDKETVKKFLTDYWKK